MCLSHCPDHTHSQSRLPPPQTHTHSSETLSVCPRLYRPHPLRHQLPKPQPRPLPSRSRPRPGRQRHTHSQSPHSHTGPQSLRRHTHSLSPPLLLSLCRSQSCTPPSPSGMCRRITLHRTLWIGMCERVCVCVCWFVCVRFLWLCAATCLPEMYFAQFGPCPFSASTDFQGAMQTTIGLVTGAGKAKPATVAITVRVPVFYVHWPSR